MATKTNRTHIVFIPGFGGFDALGQLRYYEGVVPRFGALADAGEQGFDRATVHFFENLPTAAVHTRALRLWDYLVKRVERREIVAHDSLVLVGHSTGALDLRMLVALLGGDRRHELYEAFPSRDRAHVDAASALLTKALVRAVFLSAPHRGSGLATRLLSVWAPARALFTSGLHAGVRGLRCAVLLWGAERLLAVGRRASGSQLFEAAFEAARESSPRGLAGLGAADAREAFSDLYLWSRNLAEDMASLEDLSVESKLGLRIPSGSDDDSPWARIEALSILTRAPAPAPHSSDKLYALAHGLTSAGAIQDAPSFTARAWRSGETVSIADPRENDGIVNTCSMHWPLAACQRLVEADHGDVIGHFGRIEAPGRPGGRAHRAFDLLDSGSPFGADEFGALWDGVLRFCASGTTYGM